jgi:hypothetical protein
MRRRERNLAPIEFRFAGDQRDRLPQAPPLLNPLRTSMSFACLHP